MKISQNKFIINHNSKNNNNKNNASNCLSPMIFYKTTNTTTAATVTVAIMILMHAIVSVNTTETVDHALPDTEITNTTTTTTMKAKAAKVTWMKTLYDLSKNPIITQQSPKLSTKIQTPPSLFSSSAAASAALNSFLMSNSKTTTTTRTMAQPTVRTVKTYALATTLGECKSLTAAWGDVNPNIFYICDTQTKKPLQLRCPEGRGFFLGLGYSGCIPYEQWPACVLSGHLEQVAVCDSEHMQQPWECKNPNKFFVCLKETIEPTMLNCESGKGFVHAIVRTSAGSSSGGGAGITSEILGCANWEKWRNYMHCNDYY